MEVRRMLGSRRSRRRLTTALAGLGLFVTGAALQVTTTATPAHAATTHRVLFDDGHAEEAGNADWIISTSKPDPLSQDSSPSSETDWTGALSSWGVALQKTGDYSLKTATSALTYGGSTRWSSPSPTRCSRPPRRPRS
jgi:hypothetical protein